MSSIQYVRNILDRDWEPQAPGRWHPVPKPGVSIREGKDLTRLRGANMPVSHVTVKDGGPENHEPASLGFVEEDVGTRVTVEVRVAGRDPKRTGEDIAANVRFNGARDAYNESEKWGGVKGEVERVLRTVRAGDEEYDLVYQLSWHDQTSMAGRNIYMGSWDVLLDKRAVPIPGT